MKTTRPSSKLLDQGSVGHYEIAAGSLVSPTPVEALITAPNSRQRCTPGVQAPLDRLIEGSARKLFSRQQELRRLTAQGPAAGSIWTTRPEREEDLFGPLVLVLEASRSDREALWVAEVTQDGKKFENGYMRLSRRTSGLHFSCIIRASVVFHLEPQRLLTCAGIISQHQIPAIVSGTRAGKMRDSEQIFAVSEESRVVRNLAKYHENRLRVSYP